MLRKILFFGLAVFFLACGWGVNEARRGMEIRGTQQKAKAKEATAERRFTEDLAKWVYACSKRTSRRQASLIAAHVLANHKSHAFLLLALIEAESEFNPSVMSKVGAIGLGQIRFEIHGDILKKAGIINERRDLFDPRININATAFLLAGFLRETKGDVIKALERYVGGKDSKYIHRILANYIQLLMLERRQTTPMA